MKLVKQIFLIILILQFSAIYQKVFSQIEIIVGNQEESSGTSAAPYNNDSKSRRIQILYTSNEINSALTNAGLSTGIERNIIAIAWDIYSNHALNDLTNYQLSMGNTTVNELSYHSYDANVLVKNSFTFSPNGTGWQNIVFDNNFEWDGTSNIIIDVCWQTSYSSTGASCWMYSDESNLYRMRNQSSAFSNMCGAITLSVNTIKPDLKPRIKLFFECENIDVSVTPVSSLCNTNVINNLTGNEPPDGYSGHWTVIQGSGTFNDYTQYNTEVSNVGQGTNIYRWTITKLSDGCSNFADLTVINNTPTTPNAGQDISVCTSYYNLNANIPIYGTGVWSVSSGTGFFEDNTLYNTEVSNLSGSNTGTQNVFTWTITNNGCSLSDDVVITYYLPPNASVSSSPLTGCYNTETLTLNGNDPSLLTPPATGLWTVVSGSGNFTNPEQYNTTVSNVGSGQNIYRWTLTRNGCSSSANLVINNSSPSLATAGTDQLISVPFFSLQGNSPSVGSGTWTVNPSGPIITDPTNPNTTVNNILENITYTFTWTISNGTCPSSSDDVVIVRLPNITGLIIQENLTNDGIINQSSDNNFFTMTGSNKFIWGGLSSNNSYTNTKLRVTGSITFNGEIDNGKFDKTQITANASLTIAENRIYKNHLFENFGFFYINNNSVIQNSGNFQNQSNFFANPNSTVIFDGSDMQYIKTNTNGSNNFFGNVIINQIVTIPTYLNGINLQDNFIINQNSILNLQKGVITIHENDALVIINNPNYDAITGNYDQSWIYGKSPTRALRRYLDDVTAEYVLPLGNTTNPNIAILNNINLPNGNFYIDVFFNDSPTNCNVNFPTDLTENGFIYEQIVETGTWVILPNGSIDGSYDLKLYHNGFGLISPNDDNNFCILKRPWGSTDGSSWIIPAGSTFIQKEVADGYAHRSGMSSFSEFAIAKNYNPLPVKLVECYYDCNSNILYWSTSSEKNNQFFSIEKSNDAFNWNEVAKIYANNNSSDLITYNWENHSISEKSYLRLKQIDIDNKTEILKIIFIDCKSNSPEIEVYPNPFINNIYIQISETDLPITLKLFNMLGEMVFHKELILKYQTNLNLHYLPPGVYYLKIFGNNFSKTFKLEKF